MKRKYLLIVWSFSLLFFTACRNSAGGSVENQPESFNSTGVKTVLTKTTVDELNEFYTKDKNRFTEICSGKPIVITGEFGSIDDNKGESLAVVKSGATGATIRVVFKNFNTEPFYQIEENEKVVVQGKCETAPDGFVINGTNILPAKEAVQKSSENENANDENQSVPKK